MKNLYLQIFDFFYRINLKLKPAFETELTMAGFLTGIYLGAIFFFTTQGIIMLSDTNAQINLNILVGLILGICSLNGLLISLNRNHPLNKNRKDKQTEELIKKSDYALLLFLFIPMMFYLILIGMK